VAGTSGSNAELSNARHILGKFRRICAKAYYFGAALPLPLVLWTGGGGLPGFIQWSGTPGPQWNSRWYAEPWQWQASGRALCLRGIMVIPQ